MNEREFILRMVIALANKSGYNEFEAAKEFAAEARKRGLFEAAPLTPYGESLLAQAHHDLDAENARLRQALDEIANSRFCNYDNTPPNGYGTGVTDGHRYCAKIARAALTEKGE